jgi:hypothetical protein
MSRNRGSIGSLAVLPTPVIGHAEASPFRRSKSMSGFDAYQNSFPNARLSRSKTGVLEVALDSNGGTLVFNGHTHEQFVDFLSCGGV